MDPQEAWKHWFEATTDVWKKATEPGADPLGLTTQWLEMMEEARAKLSAGGALPADPFTFLKQWYDATNETWSKAIGDIIGTEKFMEMGSQFLESYASPAKHILAACSLPRARILPGWQNWSSTWKIRWIASTTSSRTSKIDICK